MVSEKILAWRGNFHVFHDCQSVNHTYTSQTFELKIAGEWWPISWTRFRHRFPEAAAQIMATVKDAFSKGSFRRAAFNSEIDNVYPLD